MAHALVILANGFEELEAITIIDILRRAEISVMVAGLDEQEVTGSHGVVVRSDDLLTHVQAIDYDAVILPGGEPGSTHLQESSQVTQVLNNQNDKGKLVAAICAAPRVLEKAGLLAQRKATSYPSVRKELLSCEYEEESVVFDQNIMTSRGPGTAMAFSFELVKVLKGDLVSEALKKAMLYSS